MSVNCQESNLAAKVFSSYLCRRIRNDAIPIRKNNGIMKQKQRTETKKTDPQFSPSDLRWRGLTVTVAVMLMVAGYLLMLPPVDVRAQPGGRFAATPGPGAFEARRIRVAPLLCWTGYVLVIPAIICAPRRHEKETEKPAEM